MNTDLKKFELYHVQKYTEVESALLLLTSFINEDYFDEFNNRAVWYYLRQLTEMIKDKDTELPDWPQMESCVKMIDLSLLNQFYTACKDFVVAAPTEEIANAAAPRQETPPDLVINQLVVLGVLSDKVGEIMAELDEHPENREKKIDRINKLADLADDLSFQLKIVCAFLRLNPFCALLPYDDMIKMLNGEKKDLDPLSVLVTLRESFKDKYAREFVRTAVDMVTVLEGEYNWYNAVLLTLLLHLSFNQFYLLSEDEQTSLLQNNFYQAIVAGVNVEQKLQDTLYETKNVAEYLVLSKFLLDHLNKNEENIANAGVVENKKLTSLFSTYERQAIAKVLDPKKQQSFAEDVYKNAAESAYVDWLVKATNVYFKIKELSLADGNLGGEMPDNLKYESQMLDLAILFVAETNWPKIAEYYKKGEAFVPLNNFLNELMNKADLNNEATAAKFVDFNEFLHNEKLLSTDKELLIFDEQENKFKWAI